MQVVVLVALVAVAQALELALVRQEHQILAAAVAVLLLMQTMQAAQAVLAL
jgi:hypothetical protein